MCRRNRGEGMGAYNHVFDQVANWIAESPVSGDRYLWAMDKQTKVITWKNRKVYSFWQGGETARLQEIFKEMANQLNSPVLAKDNDQIQQLLLLKQRIKKSYGCFLSAHNTFFGMLYTILFSSKLSDQFEKLDKRIDKILQNSVVNLDISKLSRKEIKEAAALLKITSPSPLLKIEWESLSLDQLWEAYLLEPFALQSPSFDRLSKDQITIYLSLNASNIEDYIPEIENNLLKIEPPFLRLILDQIEPKIIADHISQLDLSLLQDLSSKQIDALDFSQLTADQLKNLPFHLIDKQHWLKVDLSKFSDKSISKVFQENPWIIEQLSPQTVAAHLAKIPTDCYNFLTDDQIKEIDFNSLTDVQAKAFYETEKMNMKNYRAQTSSQSSQDKFSNFWNNQFSFNQKMDSPFYQDLENDIFFEFLKFQFPFFGNQHFFNFNPGTQHFFNFNPGTQHFTFNTDTDHSTNDFQSNPGEDIQDAGKLQQYQNNIDSASKAIAELNQIHPNPIYENVRQKILKKKSEIKADPRLIFVNEDELQSFDPVKVKENYKKFALVFHPDRNGSRKEEAAELFKLVKEAYNVLSTAE